MFRVGIVGYGNLGAALEGAVTNFPDLGLEAIFTRREHLIARNSGKRFAAYGCIPEYENKLDVLILAWGSATDLTESAESLAGRFNTVDSFDIHRDIAKHKKSMDNIAKSGGKLSVVSSGWDPGLLSLARLCLSSFMPYAAVSTLWGEGVSQGHSEAIRRIEGVRYAVQYTVPKQGARELAYGGTPLASAAAHKRVCYVVAERGREKSIEERIRSMREYFSGYETEVNFVSESEFFGHHTSLRHKGEVIAAGSCRGAPERASLSLDLSSNPIFTANILLATARAVCRLSAEGQSGAMTLFDIPPKYFYPGDPSELL